VTTNSSAYPVAYEVDTPEKLSRWLWLFKWLLTLPHVVVLWVLGIILSFALFFAWVAILVTGRYPKGLFDFVLGVTRWGARLSAYGSHLTDRYPPFSMQEEPGYPVRLKAPHPERSSRLTAFFRWLLVIPHWVVIVALGLLLWALLLIHIVMVVVAGKPNAGIFRIIIGINRWTARETAYSYLLTDRYPPFSLE
jgi:hypothetical protein